MGGSTLILTITILSLIQGAYLALPFTPDLFLIAAVYLALSSNRERTLFIVWGLGIMRGFLSCSPFPIHTVMGVTEPLTGLYTYHPLAIIFLYLILSMIRERLMSTHPFTRFLTVTAVSLIYVFFDVLLNLPVPLMERVFTYWGYIIFIALINGVASLIAFPLLSLLPIRVVTETARGDF